MQKNKSRNIFFIVLMILLFGITGYFRDVIFRYANAQIGLLEYGGEPFDFYPGLSFLGILTLKQLYIFKWTATFFFLLITWSYALLATRIWFNSKIHFRIVHVSYAALFLLAGTGFMIGKILHSVQGYYFARWLMGAGQSPVLLMILMVVFVGKEKPFANEKI